MNELFAPCYSMTMKKHNPIGGKTPNGITDKKMLVYMKHMGGQKKLHIAQEMNLTKATIYNWVREVDEYIRSTPQYRDAVEKLPELIPLAVASYLNHVSRHDTERAHDMTAARDILKMVGLFVERKATQNEDVQRMPDDQLQSELDELGRKPDEPGGESESLGDNSGEKEA